MESIETALHRFETGIWTHLRVSGGWVVLSTGEFIMRSLITCYSKTLATTALAVIGFLALPKGVQAQTVTYSGEAVVVSVHALGIANLSLEDTGRLPASG